MLWLFGAFGLPIGRCLSVASLRLSRAVFRHQPRSWPVSRGMKTELSRRGDFGSVAAHVQAEIL